MNTKLVAYPSNLSPNYPLSFIRKLCLYFQGAVKEVLEKPYVVLRLEDLLPRVDQLPVSQTNLYPDLRGLG